MPEPRSVWPGILPLTADPESWVSPFVPKASEFVTTDGQGHAIVEMTDWFEAMNRHFRYQRTVIGHFAQAIVVSKMADHRFSIETDKPNVEVSWQVTGVRHDAWADAHRIPVEQLK